MIRKILKIWFLGDLKAPGTFGSLFGIILYLLLPRRIYLWILGLISGLLLIKIESRHFSSKDPKWIILDEVIGMWITLYIIEERGFLDLFTGFLLFRFFDITKPLIVKWAEYLPGEFGIMLDDVIAGVLAGFIGRKLNKKWSE